MSHTVSYTDAAPQESRVQACGAPAPSSPAVRSPLQGVGQAGGGRRARLGRALGCGNVCRRPSPVHQRGGREAGVRACVCVCKCVCVSSHLSRSRKASVPSAGLRPSCTGKGRSAAARGHVAWKVRARQSPGSRAPRAVSPATRSAARWRKVETRKRDWDNCQIIRMLPQRGRAT
nr:EF-hand calcium-binding domain-containing protein 2 isoform X1 [Cavia porcellus]